MAQDFSKSSCAVCTTPPLKMCPMQQSRKRRRKEKGGRARGVNVTLPLDFGKGMLPADGTQGKERDCVCWP